MADQVCRRTDGGIPVLEFQKRYLKLGMQLFRESFQELFADARTSAVLEQEITWTFPGDLADIEAG